MFTYMAQKFRSVFCKNRVIIDLVATLYCAIYSDWIEAELPVTLQLKYFR